MSKRTSIAQLQNQGIAFQPCEAAAIVQQLLVAPEPVDPPPDLKPPFGPPSPSSVYLESDGRVTCPSCDVSLAVSEAAIFLQKLLSAGSLSVPGGMRYTIARALVEVDAPPFDSPADFSRALARFERGERTAVVRALLARAAAGSRSTSARDPSPFDRRRSSPRAADLRRQLREVDAQLYDHRLALRALAAMTTARPHARPRRLSAVAAGLAIGLGIIGAGAAIRVRQGPAPSPPPAAADSSSSGQADAMSGRQGDEIDGVGLLDRKRGGDVFHAQAIQGAPTTPNLSITRTTPSASRPAAKRSLRGERPAANRVHRVSSKSSSGLLSRLGLRWLRQKVALRADRL